MEDYRHHRCCSLPYLVQRCWYLFLKIFLFKCPLFYCFIIYFPFKKKKLKIIVFCFYFSDL